MVTGKSYTGNAFCIIFAEAVDELNNLVFQGQLLWISTAFQEEPRVPNCAH